MDDTDTNQTAAVEHPGLAVDRELTEKMADNPAAVQHPNDPISSTPTPAQKVDGIIAGWLKTHIHNSPVAHNVEAYNWLKEKLVHLRDAIVKGD